VCSHRGDRSSTKRHGLWPRYLDAVAVSVCPRTHTEDAERHCYAIARTHAGAPLFPTHCAPFFQLPAFLESVLTQDELPSGLWLATSASDTDPLPPVRRAPPAPCASASSPFPRIRSAIPPRPPLPPRLHVCCTFVCPRCSRRPSPLLARWRVGGCAFAAIFHARVRGCEGAVQGGVPPLRA
jgi:hypothetical protein